MAVLRDARRSAGLTQQALAERLGTQQPSVSRLENDEDTTLGRFVDYLMACGRMPFEVETTSVEGLRQYVRANLKAPRTVEAVRRWQAANDGANSLSPSPVPERARASSVSESIAAAASLKSKQTQRQAALASLDVYRPGPETPPQGAIQAAVQPFAAGTGPTALGTAMSYGFTNLNEGGRKILTQPGTQSVQPGIAQPVGIGTDSPYWP
jgi:transcriptional regulator with XRE-family HTH domain